MYPEIINIILTGYPDFNYARSAISLGVYRYLLKPIAFDELEETIASAVEKLEEYKQKTNRKQIRRWQMRSIRLKSIWKAITVK